MKLASMPHSFRIGIAFVLLGAIACANASDTPSIAVTTSSAQLAAAIDARINEPRFASASWGIDVMSLDTGRSLYLHNANQLFQPASTAKLYTAALALDTLGGDYRIPTRVLATARIEHGRLEGPLILRGMGDPTLGTSGANVNWADQLAMQVAAHGVREVQGDLIADDTYFSGPSVGAGWEARDLQSWFGAPSSALSVQENVVNVTVTPANEPGTRAWLMFNPPGAMIQVVNTMTTSDRSAQNDINLYRAPGDAILYSFGHVAAQSEPKSFKLAIADPAGFAGMLLRQALTRHGIRIDGPVRTLRWPASYQPELDKAEVLGQVLSPPIMEILTSGLKRSQNLYLQNLLQVAGVKAKAEAEQGGNANTGFLSTDAWGIRALRKLLDRIGISPGASQIEDGSGLSRQDLTTPRAMVQLLSHLASQPYAKSLRDALPIAGIDGTLEQRMRDTAAAGNVHAKTGSMTYVRCLSGYVTTASGERLVFTIMLNNFVRRSHDPDPSFDLDAMAELLAAFRGHS